MLRVLYSYIVCFYYHHNNYMMCTKSEEVGHDHVHTKSGRVPYIEILYHLQVQAKKPVSNN